MVLVCYSVLGDDWQRISRITQTGGCGSPVGGCGPWVGRGRWVWVVWPVGGCGLWMGRARGARGCACAALCVGYEGTCIRALAREVSAG
eukprot:1409852-Prymnesium_polylepis.1